MLYSDFEDQGWILQYLEGSWRRLLCQWQSVEVFDHALGMASLTTHCCISKSRIWQVAFAKCKAYERTILGRHDIATLGTGPIMEHPRSHRCETDLDS